MPQRVIIAHLPPHRARAPGEQGRLRLPSTTAPTLPARRGGRHGGAARRGRQPVVRAPIQRCVLTGRRESAARALGRRSRRPTGIRERGRARQRAAACGSNWSRSRSSTGRLPRTRRRQPRLTSSARGESWADGDLARPACSTRMITGGGGGSSHPDSGLIERSSAAARRRAGGSARAIKLRDGAPSSSAPTGDGGVGAGRGGKFLNRFSSPPTPPAALVAPPTERGRPRQHHRPDARGGRGVTYPFSFEIET